MATERRIDVREPAEPGWKERLTAAWEGLRALVDTRVRLFQAELSQKTALLARGIVGIGIAAVFGAFSVLVLTALIAALLTLLFGALWAGLLATLVLYLVVAVVGGWVGAKALSRVRLFHFPATSEEIRKDWSALRRSVSPGERVPGPTAAPAPPRPMENLEERFREGSE